MPDAAKEQNVPKPGTTRRGKPRPGRAIRRHEEDVPGSDYVARMMKLGPRDNETYLSFRMRMGGIKEGRELIMAAARRSCGNIADVCRALGIKQQNVASYLRTCGLETKNLISFRPENML